MFAIEIGAIEIGDYVLRRLLTLAILLVCVLWLVVSYLPGIQALLPVLAFPATGKWFASLSVAAFVIFVAIQLWLVYTTVVTVRASQAKGQSSLFRLKVGIELFWTALPIAMTVALAWASYALWQDLSNP